jgi:hypothetical protein
VAAPAVCDEGLLGPLIPPTPADAAATAYRIGGPLRSRPRSGKGFNPTSAGDSALPSPRLARVSASDRPARMAAPVAADSATIARSLTCDLAASTSGGRVTSRTLKALTDRCFGK